MAINVIGRTKNYIYGTNADDVIFGSDDEDIIYGRLGSDTIYGSAGADIVRGDESGASNFSDTINYQYSSSAIQIDLFQITQHGGDAEGDQLYSIENIVGSVWNDTLLGNDLDNLIIGGAGRDVIDGRGGSDTVSYLSAASSMTIRLDNGGIDGTATQDKVVNYGIMPSGTQYTFTRSNVLEDTLSNIENIIGTSYGDHLYGSEQANRLSGGAGNDEIHGYAGSDTLLGGANDDLLIGGSGNDLLFGGKGFDTFVFHAATGSYWANGNDIVEDYEIGVDQLLIQNISSINDLTIQQSGTDTLISFNNAPGSIRLTGINSNEFLAHAMTDITIG